MAGSSGRSLGRLALDPDRRGRQRHPRSRCSALRRSRTLDARNQLPVVELVELVAGAEDAAGALSVLAAAGAALAAESADAPAFAPAAAGLADEYKSLYQPPPLKETAAAVTVRSIAPAQWGQTVSGASENFWIFSTRRPHCRHSYSYRGMVFRDFLWARRAMIRNRRILRARRQRRHASLSRIRCANPSPRTNLPRKAMCCNEGTSVPSSS